MFSKKLNDKKGFTLIEIVIVLVIIAILAAILVPNLLKWVDKSKDTNMLSAAKTIKDCVASELVEMYKNGEKLGADETAYDEDFWSAVSDAAGTTVTNDSTKDGYVKFTVEDDSIVTFSYTKGDRTATLNESGSFVITANADKKADKEPTATTKKSETDQTKSTEKSDSNQPTESTKKADTGSTEGTKKTESTKKTTEEQTESTKNSTKKQTETTTKKDQQGAGGSSWWDWIKDLFGG